MRRCCIPIYAVYLIIFYFVFRELSRPTQAEIDDALCARMGQLVNVDPGQFYFEFNTN